MFHLAQHIYGFEGTPAAKLFMAGFGLVVMLALLQNRLPFVAWILVAILCANALGPSVVPNRTEYIQSWLLPVQIRRAELHLGFSLVLIFVLLVTGKLSLAKVPWPAWFLFAIQMLSGALQMIHEGPEQGIQTLVFAVTTIPIAGIAAQSLACDEDGALKLVRSMLVVSALWAGACSVQFLIEPAYLINANGRFFGMLANPQMAGLFIAPSITMAVWSMLNDPAWRSRILWIGLTAIYTLFLGWTGSRTCLLMTIVGLTVVLASRPGKLLLFLPVAGILTFALALLSGELQIGANLERLTSTENTRGAGLARLVESIAANPWIGQGWDDLAATENSFLAGFAGYGIAMALLLLAFTFVGVGFAIKLWMARSSMLPKQRAIAELVVAFIALYFVGSNFEGYLLGRSSTAQTMMVFFGAIGVWLLRAGNAQDALAEHMAISEYAQDHGDAGYEAPPAYDHA